jgi:hypothetical protein
MELTHIAILLESIDSKVQITIEAVSALDKKIDTKIDELQNELKQDIAVVDSKVMGLSKRLDAVEERLSGEIADVKADLTAHRNNTELHHAQSKRPLKRA